jgi:hypothetical protein
MNNEIKKRVSISRGGIYCAKDWYLLARRHEIKKDEKIFWVQSGNEGRLLGYCGFCFDELFGDAHDQKIDIGL